MPAQTIAELDEEIKLYDTMMETLNNEYMEVLESKVSLDISKIPREELEKFTMKIIKGRFNVMNDYKKSLVELNAVNSEYKKNKRMRDDELKRLHDAEEEARFRRNKAIFERRRLSVK